MAWNYAELSKAAKEAGGPETFVDALAEASREQGRLEMAPWLVAAAAGGAGTVFIIKKLKKWFKSKQDKSEEKVIEAKSQLVLKIEEFDAEHSDDDDGIMETSESK